MLYDRHFLFEHAASIHEHSELRLTDRIHNWLLFRLFPRPHLTMLLDAPVVILQQRKKEQSLEKLTRHREAALRIGSTLQNFVMIDATRDVDAVFADVKRRILDLCNDNQER